MVNKTPYVNENPQIYDEAVCHCGKVIRYNGANWHHYNDNFTEFVVLDHYPVPTWEVDKSTKK